MKPSLQSASILVVDDVPANLNLLTSLLQARGCIVRPVPSGELALEAAKRQPPDLILLDIDMPGISGYEVCKRLKAEPRLASAPVIFLTALDAISDKTLGFSLGAVDYITKPFQVEEVGARVKTHLELARLHSELEQHNARLEETVTERTKELEEAKGRLAVLDQAKSDFLKLISHEIRTPLNGVIGIAELLLDSYTDSTTAALGRMFQQSRRQLMTIIDDALLLTQIGAGADAAVQERCQLSVLLNQARDAAAPFAQSRNLFIAPAPPNLGQVSGSAGYLVRALQSLMETAVKFAQAKSTVRLSVETSTGSVELRIEAEGRSIPPQSLPRFFSLLGVGEMITPGGDLGLAPAVAERIVSLYGGSVSVENLVQPGVRLSIRLKTPETTNT